MQHKTLRIIAGILGCLSLGCVVTYNYLAIRDIDPDIRWAVKVSPVAIYILFTMLYILLYRITVYSILTLSILFTCMLGDIFIEIYDIPFENFIDNPTLYFILGGISYFIARILLTGLFMLKPYNKISRIYHEKVRIITCHLLFVSAYIALAITVLVIRFNTVSICVAIYLMIGFGFAQSYAFLRIGAVRNLKYEESVLSSCLGFISICLFNISQLFIIISTYTKILPWYIKLISCNIYWVALALLTISIIRSKSEDVERGYFLIPIVYEF